VGLCQVGKGLGICYGCGRNLEEISKWRDMTEQEREAVMDKSRDRLENLFKDDLK
jgi:predicted Fe-S protein YdhL (DUF1289 family)